MTAGAPAHGVIDGRIDRRVGDHGPVHGQDRDVPEPAGRRGTEPATTGYVKGTYMSQKRLLALVGVFAIMAAACGGSSASSPPAASGLSLIHI